MSANEKLLREYVRTLLREDYGGGDGGYGGYDYGGGGSGGLGGGMGGMWGGPKDLYNIFVRPFTDVVATAAGRTKEMSERGLTLLRVAFESVATTLVPFLRDSYDEIFQKERDQLDKIQREYSEVYKRTADAFDFDDVQLAAFMYSPASAITKKFVRRAPKVAIELISVLTGGTIDPFLEKVKTRYLEEEPGAKKTRREGVIREDAQRQSIEDILTDPKVIEKVRQGQLAQQMEQQGHAIIRGTLEQVYKQASAVLKANSLEDLQTKIGKPLKGLDKLRGIPKEEREVAEQQILAGTKKSMKSLYVKGLEAKLQAATKGGVFGDDNPYVRDVQAVISKIKAL